MIAADALAVPPAALSVASQSVIASMREHGIGFTSDNYTVWHCYLTGANVALRRAIDVLLSNGVAIEERTLRSLYARYFGQAQEAIAVRDVAQRGLLTLNELAGGLGEPDPGAVRACLERLHRDLQDIVSQSDKMTHQLTQSEERVAQLEHFLDYARQEASTDALTGIANRRAFDQALRTKAAESMNDDASLSVLLLDIDHFKLVNDRYGHPVGDDVLRMTAATLVRHVRRTDLVARYGGEEFAVILPAADQYAALVVAENLRAAVERQGPPVAASVPAPMKLTISVGAACYDHGENLATWVSRADGALYRAKAAGRNRVEFGDTAGAQAVAARPVASFSRAG